VDQDTSAKLKQQGLFELRSAARMGVRPAQLNLALKNVAQELGIDEG